MERKEKIEADYGFIDVGKKSLEFYIFDKEINIEIARGIIMNQNLSDGRYVVGTMHHGGLIINKALRALKIKKGGLEIKTTEPFKLRKQIDEETKNKIINELLTRKCSICKKPTEYSIDFTRFIIRDPFGGCCGSGYMKHACLEHLNQIIEREKIEKVEAWDVVKSVSVLDFSDSKSLGRVKYDNKKGRFIPCSSIPPREVQPEKSSLEVNGKLIYRFDSDVGLLEIGDEDMVEQIKEQIAGDEWKGGEIKILLPFNENPIKFVGIKEVRYSNK